MKKTKHSNNKHLRNKQGMTEGKGYIEGSYIVKG